MQIDIQKIEIAMARKTISKAALAKKMRVSSGWLSVQLARGRNGLEVQPKTVGRFASALGCDVTEIVVKPTETAA